MIDDNAAPAVDLAVATPWLRDSRLPQSREDRVAEALALVALLFSLCVGVVIAMLPVSAQAVAAADPGVRAIDLALPRHVAVARAARRPQ
jgi:hypothetical protein